MRRIFGEAEGMGSLPEQHDQKGIREFNRLSVCFEVYFGT
jgi:hypothetical protein